MALSEFNAKQLERGVGLTCPRDDCQGKFVANPQHDGEANGFIKDRDTGNMRSMTCPYCARPSQVPEDF